MHEETGHVRPHPARLDSARPGLDRLIDGALGTYADADSGLEHRVLARIAAERRPQPRLRWMLWAGALTAAACVLLVLVLMQARPARSPVENAFHAPPMQQAPKAEARFEPRPVQRRSGPPHHAHGESAAVKLVANRLPKRDIFPTPHGPSPEEQILVDFAERAPKAEREAFVNNREQASGPIAIAAIRVAPIQIPPIEPPDTGAN